jgi:hypothetical protein
MNVLLKLAVGTTAALGLAAGGAVLTETAAWAPQMVATELAAQRALGYQPCEPIISQLPAELAAEGVLADAAPAVMFQTCEIRFAANVPAEDLDWVAWHEVAHLSTMVAIYADPASATMDDPAHCHPLFLELIEQGPQEKGGYGHEMCEAN